MTTEHLDPDLLDEGLRFLAGGGAATRLILERDWTSHPLGEPADWPDSLKATLSTVLNSPESMILAWGKDELSFFFNETYFPLLGPRLSWAMGSPFREVWSDAWEQAKPIIDDAFAGRSQRFDNLPWKLDTDRGPADTWFTFSYSRVLDARGEIAGLFIFTNETTGRVLADQALAESQEELRALNATLEQRVRDATADRDRTWNNARDLLLVVDDLGVFRAVNPAWTSILGWSQAELVGHSYLEFIHPDDHPSSEQALETASSGDLPTYENRYRHKDGSYRTISWVSAPEERMIYASGRDVTGEREVAEQLRLHRSIVLSNPNPILAFDRELRTTAFNQAHSDKFKETQGVGAAIGQRLPDHFIPEEKAAVTALMQRALTGEIFTERVEFGDPAYAKLHWDLHYSPLRDAAGEVVGASHHAIEVTAQVEAEHALANSQEALRQSQKMEAVGQLTGGIAHDFNNLLTIIRGSVDLLRRPDMAPERRTRYLEAVSDTVDRASKLTGQLLAFARRQALKPETFDVGERVRTVADMLDTLVGARIRIDVEADADRFWTHADAPQFETALINMAVNARDAMDGTGTLTLSLSGDQPLPSIRGHAGAKGPFIAIALTDTGSGIAPERIDQIFEPFYTTKNVGKGTGLGLSQVFGFAKQSGGDIDVTSVADRGSTFTLYLPQAERPEQAAAERQAQPLPVGGRRVLVVEDNLEVGRFATEMLTDLGYENVWVTNAEDALEKLDAADHGFDIVFSDVVMPGMGGIALAREIKARDIGLPVILASGYSHVLAEEGVREFTLLRKPYSADQLVAVLTHTASASQ